MHHSLSNHRGLPPTKRRSLYVRHHILLKSACAIIFPTLLSACGKDERQLTTEERMKAVTVKQESDANFYLPRKTVDYMADLKSLQQNRTEQAPAANSANASRPAVATAPQGTALAAPGAQSAAIPAAASSTAASAPIQTPTTAQPPALQPSPTVSAPSAATPLVASAPATVASAPPRGATPALQSESSAPRASSNQSTPASTVVVNRITPEFPREARDRGIQTGTVQARLSINAAGDVTNVSIVSARPVGVFNREVISTLRRWKFNPGTDNREFETNVTFQQ
jgi:TonB family protein